MHVLCFSHLFPVVDTTAQLLNSTLWSGFMLYWRSNPSVLGCLNGGVKPNFKAEDEREEWMHTHGQSYEKGQKPKWIIYTDEKNGPAVYEALEYSDMQSPKTEVAIRIPQGTWSPSQQAGDDKTRCYYMPRI